MQIPQSLPQFTDTQALIVVIGKERGVLFVATNGVLEQLVTLDEPHPHYSDREGFFMRTAGGIQLGSGEPYDDHAEADRKKLLDTIVDELRKAIKHQTVDIIYLFEPEHFKGQLTNLLEKTETVPVHLVDYGNFLKTKPLVLLEKIQRYENPEVDPSDPTLVAGEKDAAEKRKILEVGKRLDD